MGKKLIQQRRGKGSLTFTSPSHRYKAEVKHLPLSDEKKSGHVLDIVHDSGHSVPLAKVRYGDDELFMLAPEGIRVGDVVETGMQADIKLGNTMFLKHVPEGTLVYNIESAPGDGGKFVRSSGTMARVVAKVRERVKIQLPSKKTKEFHENCRATVGVLAGGDRPEKPFVKAGNKFHKMRAKNKRYPSVSGVSMNAVAHPFGGSSSHIKGRPTQSARSAPPGRKVGKLAPRRTGRKRR